jgi:hypothetical protein
MATTGNSKTSPINYVIIKHRSTVDKEDLSLLLYIVHKGATMKVEENGPGYSPLTVNYSILPEDLEMPGFNGMGPWGRGLRRDRNWRNCEWGGEFEFPGYGPAMWWDIPAARPYATQREELADLRCRAQMLTQELETVLKRIAELDVDVDRTLDG